MTSLRSCIRTLRGRWRLHRAARGLQPLRLVVGSGGIAQAGWIATDVEYLDLLKADTWSRYFRAGRIDAILAEHVWEHLTPAEGLIAAQTCFRFLRPGGYLRIAVPDGNHPDPTYLKQVRIGGTGAGANDHKALYTYDTLTSLLTTAGFAVKLLEHFDASRQFISTAWEPQTGLIRRSARYDPRNQSGRLSYTSLIADAIKPA